MNNTPPTTSPFLPGVRNAIAAIAALLTIPGVMQNAQGITLQARTSQSFVESMGVNIHPDYTDSIYYNYSFIRSKLLEVGILHVRAALINTDPSYWYMPLPPAGYVNELKTLRQHGITSLLVFDAGGWNQTQPLSSYVGAIQSTIKSYMPAVDALECTNECDSSSFRYNGTPFPLGLYWECAEFFNIVNWDPVTSPIPVLAPSMADPGHYQDLANIESPATYCDIGNGHYYQSGQYADCDGWDFSKNWQTGYRPYSDLLTAGRPIYISETGYSNATALSGGVSERASGIYVPLVFCEGFRQGYARTYLYEFIDGYPDPSGTNWERHFGLLRNNGTPKPAYTALKNTIYLLNEWGASFSPQPLSVTIGSAPSTVHYMLLQRSTGVYFLAVWNDVSVYNTSTVPGTDVYPAKVPVTFTFSKNYQFSVYAPCQATGATPTSAYTLSTTSKSIRLNVPAELLIIKIAP